MKSTKNYIFFYGAEDVYSNFHRVRFSHEGKTFHCSEQAVMYRKAMLFGNQKIANQILLSKTAMDAKRLGRSREIGFDEKRWEQNREQIYFEVLMDKFSIPKLRQALIQTNDKTLVEASPRDEIWGVGLAANDPRILYPNQWKGLNLLGKTLMRVREQLK